MAWEWSVEGDGVTHVWAATYNGSSNHLQHSFETTPSLNYYHRWEADMFAKEQLMWQVCGPPNGDGVALPSWWQIADCSV